MKIKLTFLITLLITFVNAQIYTPNGTIQGVSTNNNIGIGTSTPNSQLSLTKVSSILGDPQSISLYEDSFANYGFAVNSAQGGLDFCANQAVAPTSFRWFGGANKSTPKQLMVLLGNNQLGIGGSPIFGKLELFNTSYGTQAFSFYTNDGSVNSRALVEHITTSTSQRVNFTSAFSSGSGNANWTFENGNIGVGTLMPSEKLHVLGRIRFAVNQSANNEGYYGSLESFHASNTGVLSFVGAGGAGKVIGSEAYGTNTVIYSDATEKIRILNNGNVGIGTTIPNAKLSFNHTSGTLGDPQTISLYEDATANYGFAVNGPKGGLDFCANQAAASSIFRWYGGTDKSLPSLKMIMANNGNVGIGTPNPTSKLTVAGNIASREVKVTVDAGADFVFENDYNLTSLESVDQFIKENKHLPEIASAKTMQKDGINLSEMNIKLLQKIEELTLYTIEQYKNTEKLTKAIDTLTKRLEILERK